MTENKNENRGTVLIVEDEFLIALDLEAAMSGLGYEVCGLAPNGDEARSLAMDHQPDVVPRRGARRDRDREMDS